MDSRLLNISESLSLALHSLKWISHTGATLSATGISERTGMSVNHLSKVLRKLVKGGVLSASKGPGGGFYLTEKQSQKKLIDVYLLFEKSPSDKACIYENPLCDKKKCVFGGLLCKINDDFLNYFKQTSIADLG